MSTSIHQSLNNTFYISVQLFDGAPIGVQLLLCPAIGVQLSDEAGIGVHILEGKTTFVQSSVTPGITYQTGVT
jgi:hypothetical protein